MSSTSNRELFTVLPEGTRIPASQVRLVTMHRSLNVASLAVTGSILARAHLVTVFSLRGTYIFYVFLELGGGRQALLGGSHWDVPVARYGETEQLALQWLTEHGFHMALVELSTLTTSERHATLMALPFAQVGDDFAQGVGGSMVPPEQAGPSLDDVFGELDSMEILNQLLSLLRAG